MATALCCAVLATFMSPSTTIANDLKGSKPGSENAQVTGLSLVVNKSRVIRLDQEYATALVGKSEIADVVPLTTTSIYVLGKEIGSTRIVVLDPDKHVVRILEVEVTSDLDGLRQKLRENVRSGHIEVTAIKDGILLSGTLSSPTEVKKAMSIAEHYAPKKVTNALQVAAAQQVLLEVRFVEATRRAARELGISSRVRNSDNTIAFDSGPQALADAVSIIGPALASGAQPFGSLLARLIEGGTNVDILIRALEDKRLARRLAEPNLIALSGDTASFLAGGEFPFPVAGEDNSVTIEFKKFGVGLAFTPTVLDNGLINLKIMPEVSEIDAASGVTNASVSVPGLVVRRAKTTVELRDGQSFAIAGLLQTRNSKTVSQLPWIGNVPVLGALFRSSDYQKSETDLVIIVTPRLVKPKRPGEKLITPLDRSVASNDKDFFLKGRMEIDRTGRSKWGRHTNLSGHIISFDEAELKNAAH